MKPIHKGIRDKEVEDGGEAKDGNDLRERRDLEGPVIEEDGDGHQGGGDEELRQEALVDDAGEAVAEEPEGCSVDVQNGEHEGE